MKETNHRHIFGPVPSRRLGMSLGIDLVPYKTCTLNCVYCECGKTTDLTIKRKNFFNLNDLFFEIKTALKKKRKIDHITLSGAGEPTLNKDIGRVIRKIKSMTAIPVAVLTNGTLLYRKDVREDLKCADIVIPSLDAVSEKVFNKINRAHKNLKLSRIIEGMKRFRKEYGNKIWLEILVVRGYNDSIKEFKKIATAVRKIKPDRIQLNTCIRPGTVRGLKPLKYRALRKFAGYFNVPVDIFAKDMPGEKYKATKSLRGRSPWQSQLQSGKFKMRDEEIIEMLKRRPCTIRDLCTVSNSSARIVTERLRKLKSSGLRIKSEKKNSLEYFYIQN